MARPNLENILIGLAGEHAVASQLSLRHFVASMTLKNFPGVDIFYRNLKTGVTEPLQVKATEESWVRIEEEPGAKFTVLVDFSDWDKGVETDFYIMPSRTAHELALRDRHLHAEHNLKEKGKRINEEKWPIGLNLLKGDYWEELRDELEKYKSNWKLLE